MKVILTCDSCKRPGAKPRPNLRGVQLCDACYRGDHVSSISGGRLSRWLFG
jgi:hypothetical protein